MLTEVSPLATVRLDGSGNGQVSLGPPSGTRWALRLATTAVAPVPPATAVVKSPLVSLYRGSASGPIELVDTSTPAPLASSGKVGGPPYYPGQLLWAVWTGGDAGAVATLQAWGQQGARSDPFEPSVLGEGFASPVTSITLPSGAQSPAPRTVIGPDIPAALQAFYSGIGSPVSSAIVSYFNATDFYYQVWSANASAMFRATGWYVGGVFYEEDFGELFAAAANRPITRTFGLEVNPPGQGTGWVVAGRSDGTLDPAAAKYSSWNFQGPDVLVDSRSLGRGLVFQNSSAASVGGFGPETVVLTSSVVALRNARAFIVVLDGTWLASVASQITVRLRRNGLAGQILREKTFPLTAVNTQREDSFVFTNSSGADVTDKVVVTTQASAGTVQITNVGGTGRVRFDGWDLGAAGDWAGYTSL